MTDALPLTGLPPSIPGDTICDVLREQGLSQADLALRTGYSRKHVNDLVRGRAAISYEAALKLEAVLGSTADFWMRREVQYREAVARRDQARRHRQSAPWLRRLPVAGLVGLGWVAPHEDRAAQVQACLRFFGVASVEAWEETHHDLLHNCGPAAGPATAAWLRQGEMLARHADVRAFDAAELRRLLPRMRTLVAATDPRDRGAGLARLCARAGVALVVLPAPRGCTAPAAVRWISTTRAMVLLREGPADARAAWAAFFRAMCHVLRHGRKPTFIDGAPGADRELATEAELFAAGQMAQPEDLRRRKSEGPATRGRPKRV